MGRLLTTAEAAEVMGLTPTTMRSIARFARDRGVELRAPKDEWLDTRTPMYDEARLIEYRDYIRPNRAWPLTHEQIAEKARAREAAYAQKKADREARRQKERDAEIEAEVQRRVEQEVEERMARLLAAAQKAGTGE